MRLLMSILSLLMIANNLNGIEKLDPCYLTRYGQENAPIKIVEYFSFQCPHCIKVFRADFLRIKETYIDTGKVYFEFHPVPLDLPTMQALICLSYLDNTQKQLFLEVILEEAVSGDQALMAKLMITAMNVFKKPLPQLDDPDFVKEHKALNDAFLFLKQEEKILAVPAVEVNNRLFANDIPDLKFMQTALLKD